VVYSIVLSIPLIGTWLAYAAWLHVPGHADHPPLFVIHEFLFPLIILGLLTAHLMILWRQKHSDFPGPGKTEHNIVAVACGRSTPSSRRVCSCWCSPSCRRSAASFRSTPSGSTGPTTPIRSVPVRSQTGTWVGSTAVCACGPTGSFRSFGHEIANPFFPGVLVPGIVFTLMFLWPQIDRRIYHDYVEHNLLDRPGTKRSARLSGRQP